MAEEITVRTLLTRLGVRADTSAVKSYDASLNKAKQTITNIVKVAVGAATSGALVNWVTKAAKSMAEYSDKVIMASDATQANTDTIQEMRFAFEGVYADANDLSDAFSTLADKGQDVLDGTKSMVDDFGLLNVKAKDLKGKKPEEIFTLIADRVANAKDQTKALASVVRIFGDDLGRKIMPLLQKGSKGIEAIRKEARELGIVLDKETLVQGQRWQGNLMRLNGLAQGLRNTILARLLPTLNRGAEKMIDFSKANREVIKTRVDQFFTRVGKEAERARKFLKQIGGGSELEGLKRIGEGLKKLLVMFLAFLAAKKVIALFQLLQSVVTFLATVGLAGLSKFLAIATAVITAVTLIATALNEVWVTLQGGDSIITRVLSRIDKGNATLKRVMNLFHALGRVGKAVFALIGRTAKFWFTFLWEMAKGVFSLLKAGFEKLAPVLKPVVSSMLDHLTLFFNVVADWLENFDKNWLSTLSGGAKYVQAFADFVRKAMGDAIDYVMNKFDKVTRKFQDLKNLATDNAVTRFFSRGRGPGGPRDSLSEATRPFVPRGPRGGDGRMAVSQVTQVKREGDTYNIDARGMSGAELEQRLKRTRNLNRGGTGGGSY